MALRTLILAANPREGGHYAKRAGLERWTYRVIHGAGQVRGLPYNGLEVHILPSFAQMLNRASILAALRHKRGIQYFYVDPEDLPTLTELAGERQAAELGELTDEHLELAYDAHSHFDHAEWGAAQRRAQVAAMSDDEVAALLSKATPEAAAKVVEAVKQVEAAKPKPRKPRQPAPSSTSAADFFGGQ